MSRPPEAEAAGRAGARYWSIVDIQFECGISPASAWRLVRRPGFPAPLVLGPKVIRWRRTEVIEFLEQLEQPGHYAPRRQRPTEVIPAASFTSRPVRQPQR